MKSIGKARLVGVALAGFSVMAATRIEAEPDTAPSLDPFAAREITSEVHLLSTPHDYLGPAVGNVTLIEQSDGLVVIDSGLTAANGRAVVKYARMLSAKPIKAVAITHWHNDHPQGVSAIRNAFPNVRIIATAATEAGMLGPEAGAVGYRPDPRMEQEMAKLVAQGEPDLRKILEDPATPSDRRERVRKALADYRQFLVYNHGTYIVPPTEIFSRKLVIDDAETPVELLYFGRANTSGDLVAWLPKQKIVASGDIVVWPIPFGFNSYPTDWVETIDHLKALGFATLIPGHGEPQPDTRYLEKLQTAIRDIRAQVGAIAKTGASLDEVRKKVDFSKSIALFGTTPRAKANAQGLFFEPMIANAYKEAKGQPVIQGEGNPPFEYKHTPPQPSSNRHDS